MLFSAKLDNGPGMDWKHINVRFPYKTVFKFALEKFENVANVRGSFRG